MGLSCKKYLGKMKSAMKKIENNELRKKEEENKKNGRKKKEKAN